jgi:hypothetical protein
MCFSSNLVKSPQNSRKKPGAVIQLRQTQSLAPEQALTVLSPVAQESRIMSAP